MSVINAMESDEPDSRLPDPEDERALAVVIAHQSPATRDQLERAVGSLGHHVRTVCERTPDLEAACLPAPPDLILCGVDMPGGDVTEALIRISEVEPTPAIIVTPKETLADVERALRDHVMAYLVEPLDEGQIKPTIYLVEERFKQFEALKAENDDLRQALAERKLIERAKGLLMGHLGVDEDHAFRRLQKIAQSGRSKLAQAAQAVIDAADSTNGMA